MVTTLKKIYARVLLPGLLLLSLPVFLQGQTLRINEVLPSNHQVNMDPDRYAFSDWIELYNPSSSALDISGYTLSNEHTNLKKWRFPYGTVIPARSYILLWADSVSLYGKAYHLNFKLQREGGAVWLAGPDGHLLDSLIYPETLPDITYGRDPDVPGHWVFFPHPTPGDVNRGATAAWLLLSHTPELSVAGGFYDRPVRVTLYSEDRDAEIRYTLDGSEPTASSSLYTSPLDISVTTVLRAVAFEKDRLKSKTLTQTYFIGEDISLPVISLSIEPKYFWDDSIGFYVEGTNGLTGWASGHGPSPKSNFNRDWKRPMHIEFYDEQHRPGFAADGEVKVYGGWTRAAVIKSLAVYTYDPINYKLFPERSFIRYKSFLLRNGGNEWAHTKLRDAVLQSLAINETDVDLQANRPAVLFINGEFWGVLNIREKINPDYIKLHHGVPEDSIDYIEQYTRAKAGDLKNYNEMMDYVRNHDLSDPTAYNHVKQMVDVQECLNYFMTGIYSGHGDWIYNNNNNVRIWRPRTEGGRWRWLLYDTDGAFTTASGRGIETAVGRSEILAALLKNQEARKYFIDRFTALLNSTFAPERALHMIDSLKALISPAMPRHIAKWKNTDDAGNPAAWKTPGSGEYIQSQDGYGGPCLSSYGQWESYFGNLRSVASVRAGYLLDELHNYFSLGTPRQLRFMTAGGGIIEVNGILQRDYSRATTWFDGQQLQVSALPRYGYRFREWRLAGIEAQSLLPAGSVWRYLDDGSDPGTAWREPDYDDSAWKSGAAELGYGDGDETTVTGYGPDPDNKYLTTYFRTHFSYDDTTTSQLRLDLKYDDGAIVYLNGREVVRVNLADGTITSQTAALSFVGGEAESAFTSFFLPGDLLQQGDNVVAVEIHQVSPASTDISFDLRLSREVFTVSDSVLSRTATFTHTVHGDLQMIAVFDTVREENTLRLNEIVAKNRSYPTGSPTTTSDWIELVNTGREAVALHDLYLSNDPSNPRLCRVGEPSPGMVIPSHDHYVLWADGRRRPAGRHLNFKLDGKGGTLVLFREVAREMVLLDSLHYERQAPDMSLSRIPDGAGPWLVTDRPTPARENELYFRPPVSNILINEIHTREDPRANEWIELYNDNDEPVDAGGLFLTTDLDRPTLYRIPPNRPWQTVIPPKGFLVISNHDLTAWNRLVLPFRLEPAGGEIGLSQWKDGRAVYLDYQYYQEDPITPASGHYPDGEGSWQVLATATPGASNLLTLEEEPSADGNITLYPNPSHGSFRIIFGKDLSERSWTLHIFTLSGRLVFHQGPLREHEVLIPAGTLPRGIYLLKIVGEEKVIVRKIEIL